MSKAPKKESMTDHQFYSLMGIIGAVLGSIWLAKNEIRIYAFFYDHLISIQFFLYAMVAVLFIYAAMKLKRKFQSDRIHGLSKVWNDTDGTFLGTTSDNVAIHLPEISRTGNVQIIGATGRGKTESLILPLLMRDLFNGKSSVLIDGKGDVELLNKIKAYSKHLPNPVRVISFDLGNLNSSATTNPLAQGTAQQISDRVFASFDFKDEFYKAVQYEITSTVLELVCSQGITPNFKLLYDLLTSDDLLGEMSSKSQNDELTRRIIHWLNENRDKRNEKIAGLLSQLGVFVKGEVANLVNGEIPGRDYFTLTDLISKKQESPFVLVILLPSLLYQEMAFKLGKMFLQEIASGIALKEDKSFLPIFLDEFSSFVYPGFIGILNKARSSGVALHLSHQSLGDLEAVSPSFAKAVNTNTNVKCLLGLNDPLTADFFAKHLGTMSETKITERANEKGILKFRQLTGEMSIRETEAYRIHPNKLKFFTNGKGVVQFNTPCGISIIEEIQFERLPQIQNLKEESCSKS